MDDTTDGTSPPSDPTWTAAERLLIGLLVDLDALAEAENLGIEHRSAVKDAVAYLGGWEVVFAAHGDTADAGL